MEHGQGLFAGFNDGQLARARRGALEDLEGPYRAFSRPVVTLARQLCPSPDEAEDVLQETVLEIMYANPGGQKPGVWRSWIAPTGPGYNARMKIYTRAGDGGETSLLSGGRVHKADARVDAYGTVDELGSVLGVLRSEPLPDDIAERLKAIQESLFAIGAALADPEGRMSHDARNWSAEFLEHWIDDMDGELEPLRSFILPGGCRAAAITHLARTVCRRAERRVGELTGGGGSLPDGLLAFLNRLSDALFTLARLFNSRSGIAETVWRGGR